MSFEQYGSLAIQAAEEYGIDPQIFLRQIQQESNFDPTAQSSAGATGIAQFMPDTAASLGIDPSDPAQALFGAAYYLRTMLDRYGDYPTALAAYNAGPGNVDRYGGVPPFPETQTYISNILGGGGTVAGEEEDQGFSFGDAPWFGPLGTLAGWLFGGDGGDETGEDPNDPRTWSPEQRTQWLQAQGLTWVTGNGDAAIWALPDGSTLSEGAIIDRITGTFEKAQPIPGPRTASGSSDFSLSPNQTRFVRDPSAPGGYRAITAPASADPLAAEKMANTRLELAIRSQMLQFNRDKLAMELASGLRREARETQAQIFNQEYQVAQLTNDINQFNANLQERHSQRMQDLATQIGTLAQDPGDRGKYAAAVLANTGWGADSSQIDMRTPDSLAPLEQLLRIRANSMGGPSLIPQPNLQPGIGLNLGQTLPPAPTGGQLALPAGSAGPIPLAPPQMVENGPAPAGTGEPIPFIDDAPNAVYPPRNPLPWTDMPTWESALPQLEHGGMAEGAYISGEKGPELNIPVGKGKAVVLNEKQMDALGINLSRVMKMATGGIFDGLADQDRGLATGFLEEAARRQRTNTPWEGGGQLPSPVFGSSPGFDPLVLELLASMNALEKGFPAAAYKRQAALLRPAGVQEHAVRRTA